MSILVILFVRNREWRGIFILNKVGSESVGVSVNLNTSYRISLFLE